MYTISGGIIDNDEPRNVRDPQEHEVYIYIYRIDGKKKKNIK